MRQVSKYTRWSDSEISMKRFIPILLNVKKTLAFNPDKNSQGNRIPCVYTDYILNEAAYRSNTCYMMLNTDRIHVKWC